MHKFWKTKVPSNYLLKKDDLYKEYLAIIHTLKRMKVVYDGIKAHYEDCLKEFKMRVDDIEKATTDKHTDKDWILALKKRLHLLRNQLTDARQKRFKLASLLKRHLTKHRKLKLKFQEEKWEFDLTTPFEGNISNFVEEDCKLHKR